ncbi:hypothetical protein niasHT_017961 [Heterodera trifolii]|uniref:Uncharacterized protein n=1 Tax=Heterodera trifolii TaxID=157864 RepID=A0ABD2LIP9_9BILA
MDSPKHCVAVIRIISFIRKVKGGTTVDCVEHLPIRLCTIGDRMFVLEHQIQNDLRGSSWSVFIVDHSFLLGFAVASVGLVLFVRLSVRPFVDQSVHRRFGQGSSVSGFLCCSGTRSSFA